MERPEKMEDMLGRSGALRRREAQEILSRSFTLPPLPEEEIETFHAFGRVVSKEIESPEDLPPFARATMDGYAVRAGDTFGASESLAAYLTLTGEVSMGEPAKEPVGEMEAVRIATGGMLPEGADAVVMFEHTSLLDERMVEVVRVVAPGENVIRVGEDIGRDQAVLKRGHRLRPQDVGALCGLGITSISVYRQPRVAVIPTGNEIVSPDRTPRPAQVRDINSPHLAALLRQGGCQPVLYEIVPDDEKRLKETIGRAVQETDVVLLTGGSSVGMRDLTQKVLSTLGKPGILFHGVAVKPGKPTLCALIEQRPVFGLPGHPAAVVIGFDLFVKPLLRSLSGEVVPPWDALAEPQLVARLSRSVASRSGREDYFRVALEMREGEPWARPVLGKSGLISTLVDADGTIVVPETKLGLEKGERVVVRLFPRRESL
jgi:molybdopterin molybdotransferase